MSQEIDPAFARKKLDMLAEEHGCTVEEFFRLKAVGETFPGICMRRGCWFVEDYGPEEEAGWCEECGTATVVSGVVLAKIGGSGER